MKKKVYIRNTLLIAAAIILTLGVLLIYDQIKPTKIDFGNTELYTEQDMNEAIAIIKNHFEESDLGKLYSIQYAGDEKCAEELEYCNSLAKARNGKIYTQSIVFQTVFRTRPYGNVVLNNFARYSWSWHLARTENGEWDLLTWGEA